MHAMCVYQRHGNALKLSCMQPDRWLDSEKGEACSGQKAHLLKALHSEMNSVTVRPVLQVVHGLSCMQSGL